MQFRIRDDLIEISSVHKVKKKKKNLFLSNNISFGQFSYQREIFIAEKKIYVTTVKCVR